VLGGSDQDGLTAGLERLVDLVSGAAEVIVASEDGALRFYDGHGAVLRALATPGPARLLQAPLADGPVLVATAGGEVVAY